MDTDASPRYRTMIVALGEPDWARVLEGVGMAESWLREAEPGDRMFDDVVPRLVALAGHAKWEVRRAVANAAAQALHPAFEPALSRLSTDDNTRVRQAAQHAALRRRDWQNASTLGKQHEERINSILDDMEVRFGKRGRDAAKRAGEQIANTFARELYHEVIGLMTPLATSADRLRAQLADEKTTRAVLDLEAAQIEKRVMFLRAVLDAMRAYTEQPKLVYGSAEVNDLLEEAAALVRESGLGGPLQPTIDIRVDGTISVDVVRARLLQAVRNILTNAVESHRGLSTNKEIVVRAHAEEGRVVIEVEDAGCGMTTEAVSDARRLFSTSKETGTGFGLPLAVKIIESEHGGRLILESIKDHGTIVRVLIPVQQPRTRE